MRRVFAVAATLHLEHLEHLDHFDDAATSTGTWSVEISPDHAAVPWAMSLASNR